MRNSLAQLGNSSRVKRIKLGRAINGEGENASGGIQVVKQIIESRGHKERR